MDREHYWLHRLLRGELAAVESYEHALEDVGDHPARDLLASFLEDHRRAVSALSRYSAEAGDEPATSAGVWGAFARAVEKVASWVNDPTTLKALKEGEVHGEDEYRNALSENHLDAALRKVIEEELLPLQAEHVEELDLVIAHLEQRNILEGLPERVEKARAN
jgi:uncharacterized protein (TIGR02284 family)